MPTESLIKRIGYALYSFEEEEVSVEKMIFVQALQSILIGVRECRKLSVEAKH